ncbi:hypothetical protein PACTADRAFT_75823 [Pachysolen tannophilus NRRL Y-2460]|uniref:Uncharacterized protein n=1 Tax=Pachysolen tannophilus NRRL Y-2460 TaxID=669874 RepID=A0A1E4TUA0_PACTA|nr:hypothetical protein PACTADRAFT_75823 [Pachysolen tannophilus NRRL Y-2460]
MDFNRLANGVHLSTEIDPGASVSNYNINTNNHQLQRHGLNLNLNLHNSATATATGGVMLTNSNNYMLRADGSNDTITFGNTHSNDAINTNTNSNTSANSGTNLINNVSFGNLFQTPTLNSPPRFSGNGTSQLSPISTQNLYYSPHQFIDNNINNNITGGNVNGANGGFIVPETPVQYHNRQQQQQQQQQQFNNVLQTPNTSAADSTGSGFISSPSSFNNVNLYDPNSYSDSTPQINQELMYRQLRNQLHLPTDNNENNQVAVEISGNHNIQSGTVSQNHNANQNQNQQNQNQQQLNVVPISSSAQLPQQQNQIQTQLISMQPASAPSSISQQLDQSIHQGSRPYVDFSDPVLQLGNTNRVSTAVSTDSPFSDQYSSILNKTNDVQRITRTPEEEELLKARAQEEEIMGFVKMELSSSPEPTGYNVNTEDEQIGLGIFNEIMSRDDNKIDNKLSRNLSKSKKRLKKKKSLSQVLKADCDLSSPELNKSPSNFKVNKYSTLKSSNNRPTPFANFRATKSATISLSNPVSAKPYHLPHSAPFSAPSSRKSSLPNTFPQAANHNHHHSHQPTVQRQKMFLSSPASGSGDFKNGLTNTPTAVNNFPLNRRRLSFNECSSTLNFGHSPTILDPEKISKQKNVVDTRASSSLSFNNIKELVSKPSTTIRKFSFVLEPETKLLKEQLKEQSRNKPQKTFPSKNQAVIDSSPSPFNSSPINTIDQGSMNYNNNNNKISNNSGTGQLTWKFQAAKIVTDTSKGKVTTNERSNSTNMFSSKNSKTNSKTNEVPSKSSTINDNSLTATTISDSSCNSSPSTKSYSNYNSSPTNNDKSRKNSTSMIHLKRNKDFNRSVNKFLNIDNTSGNNVNDAVHTTEHLPKPKSLKSMESGIFEFQLDMNKNEETTGMTK